MKLSKIETKITEPDMTPMIDMTFQLIAFFMMVLNFAEGDQNQRIQLPDSELAQPAVTPLESPITLHVTKENTVIIGGQEVSVEGLKPFLDREASVLTLRGKSPSVAAVIIRGDEKTKTSTVQEVIKVCQLAKFEKFVLRAREDRKY
jgi:biopolymer transport protein ExbD